MIDIVASNIRGTGATELVRSLLPALEREGGSRIGTVWLPDRSRLTDTLPRAKHHRIYRRFLPNSVSRMIECHLLAAPVYGSNDLLILGDLPLATSGRQVVLVHNSFLLPNAATFGASHTLKTWLYRATFRRNMRRIRHVIVQTPVMARALADAYPAVADRIAVIPPPLPDWLPQGAERRRRDVGEALRLFYPAADYPHKNHGLLEALVRTPGIEQMVCRLGVTLAPAGSAAPTEFVGHLDQAGMAAAYSEADALIFPSLEESFGLPLLEAMTIGLPILCSNRAYARAICGDGAIYFDPLSVQSLRDAIGDLKTRLDAGWCPDWSEQLRAFPPNWGAVAGKMLALFED